MKEPLIIKDEPLPPSSNLQWLHNEGIKTLAKLAPDTWTDHNTSDPGIMLLEQLCFAITELGLTLSFPIEDLLAVNQKLDSLQTKPKKQFFTANEILTSSPISRLDLRRVLLDLEGVNNAWLEPIGQTQPIMFWLPHLQRRSWVSQRGAKPINLHGLYRVILEPKDTTVDVAALKKQAIAVLNANRNLAEAFVEIISLPVETLRLRAAVDLAETAVPEQVLAECYWQIQQYLLPSPHHQSLPTLQAQQLAPDQTHQGPILHKGFMLAEQLLLTERRQDVRTSDLIKIMMEQGGVNTIRQLMVTLHDYPSEKDWEPWSILLSSGRSTHLIPIAELIDRQELTFYKRGNLLKLDKQKVLDYYATVVAKHQPEKAVYSDLPIPYGDSLVWQDYRSIQHDLPSIFKLGKEPLLDHSNPTQLAQRSQLQAYLWLFEQVLAIYGEQTANAANQLAVEPNTANPVKLVTIPGREFSVDTAKLEAKIIASQQGEYNGKKGRLLSHLLARLGEQFPDATSLQLTEEIYWEKQQNYLTACAHLVSKRCQAINLQQPNSSTNNGLGAVKRLSALLALDEQNGETLTVVEPILLRPAGFPIQSIEAQGQDLLCVSKKHQLNNHASVELVNAMGLQGKYPIKKVNDDSFIINDLSLGARWQPVSRQVIEQFSQTALGTTACFSPAHGLKNNQLIQLMIANEAFGRWRVNKIDEDNFTLARPFQPKFASLRGEWRRITEGAIINPINKVKLSDTVWGLRCFSKQHGLSEQDAIDVSLTLLVNDTPGDVIQQNKVVVVKVVDEHNFDIPLLTGLPITADDNIVNISQGHWQHSAKLPITKLEQVENAGPQQDQQALRCFVQGHGLNANDRIELFIGGQFLGVNQVIGSEASGNTAYIDIQREFTVRWQPIQQLTQIGYNKTKITLIEKAQHELAPNDWVELLTQDKPPYLSYGYFPITPIPEDKQSFYIPKLSAIKTTENNQQPTLWWRRVLPLKGFYPKQEVTANNTINNLTILFVPQRPSREMNQIEIFMASESVGFRAFAGDKFDNKTLQLNNQLNLAASWEIFRDNEVSSPNTPFEIKGFWQGEGFTVCLSDRIKTAVNPSGELVTPGDVIKVSQQGAPLGLYTVTPVSKDKLPDYVLSALDQQQELLSYFQLDRPVDFRMHWRDVNDLINKSSYFPRAGVHFFASPGHGLTKGEWVAISDRASNIISDVQQDTDNQGVYHVTEIELKTEGNSQYSDSFGVELITGRWGRYGNVSGFEGTKIDSNDNFQYTLCLADKHSLFKGDRVHLFDNTAITGDYEVIGLTAKGFIIDREYSGLRLTSPAAKWAEIKHLAKIRKNGSGGITCQARNHQLTVGEAIVIYDLGGKTQFMDGEYAFYTVMNAQTSQFNIDKSLYAIRSYQPDTADPFSMRVVWVFPAEKGRFQTSEFRQFVQQLIRQETPAHLAAQCLWLDQAGLTLFNAAYQQWLDGLTNTAISVTEVERRKAKLFEMVTYI
ncbi:hypothetical protein H0A36_24435 [Endozoicomonas sp. SM1973]|uniref:Uncharacterized protein n=1 Tax=Spartinivicinus marinus TaxID=2994442 RepID=A0A853I774_9GAMM|nr:hypothetical protein [Spartinivicinus marinus]MCX4029614.1 hypothetical protein [Spartinivicinus marinus]NYZ69173.1 hypothetical protein [Spartinivicinus marinus]